MELRHLTTFRAVATTLSFTRAATELGYVQSAVTAHVKALEEELDVRLFDRLGRRIVLTDAGERLLGYAERILQLAAEATTTVGAASRPAGPVLISAPEVLCSYRLAPVIRALHDQHPDVQPMFRANPTGALDAAVRGALAHGDVDVAFVLEEQLAATRDLVVEHLASEPLVIVAARDHPLARLRRVEPADLDGVPVLLTDKGCPYRRVFERALAESGARAAIAGEFISAETVKSCVGAGTGIGVLAAISVESELATGRLACLSWCGPALTLNSYLVRHARRWVSPANGALLAVSHEVFAQERDPRPVAEATLELHASESVVAEVRDAVIDGPILGEAHGLYVAGFAEEPLARAEHDREDFEAQLVDEVVLHQRVHDLKAGEDDDVSVERLL